jgi:hypothetical protein
VGADNVVAVLDDLPEQCAVAKALGLPVYIHHQTYNNGADYPRVYTFLSNGWEETVIAEIRRKNGRAKRGE